MQALFWISFAVLFYTHLGYGLLLFGVTAFYRKRKPAPLEECPSLTLIVPAYNEEAFIQKKIENSLLLCYPKEKLRILFVTDGSVDSTNDIIRKYSQVELLTGEKRLGKTAAINKAMQVVSTPFVVFTDANTLLHPNSLQNLVFHYRDDRIGGVSGEKRILGGEDSAVGLGERLYWQYESLLKKAEARFYTVIGAAGELFSIRTALFQPVREDVILDDFVISAKVCQQGYRFAYEEGAYAVETSSASIREEQKRKVRISAGNFQALLLLKGLLNPFRNPKLAFQFFSHRVLRWTLGPLCLPLLFITNLVLVLSHDLPVYKATLTLQSGFYLLALAGALLGQKAKLPQLLLVPYYFVFMNVALYIGFYRFLAKKQTAIWQKAVRKAPVE